MSILCSPRRVLRACALVSSLVVVVSAGACTSRSDTGVVKVDLGAVVCVDGGRCFSLGVPEAEVLVLALDGRQVAVATTDDDGRVELTVHDFGPLDVVARSPLLKGGESRGSADLTPGGMASLTLRVPLSPDARTSEP
jgi:hypothetical protein